MRRRFAASGPGFNGYNPHAMMGRLGARCLPLLSPSHNNTMIERATLAMALDTTLTVLRWIPNQQD